MADEEEEKINAEETIEEKPKKRKKKKLVRKRKSKKEKENPLNVALRLAVESGKVEFGARTGILAALLGKPKVFVIALNTPYKNREKLVSYAKLSSIPVIEFDGSTMELGSICGKPFPVSVLSVYDPGTSHILELAKKKGEK